MHGENNDRGGGGKMAPPPMELGLIEMALLQNFKFSLIKIVLQWNLVITGTLGPRKLPFYNRFLVISGKYNKEI